MVTTSNESSYQMRGIELQALRRLLFFSVEEAARMLSNASPRAWQRWESGERAVPDDVARTMVKLIGWRALTVNAVMDELANNNNKEIVVVWYSTLDDWLTMPDREPQYWRPHCSIMAEVVSIGARLVVFDAPAYAKWLDGRTDTEERRSEWAYHII